MPVINAIVMRRFEDKFIPEPNTGCWLWTESCMKSGYGAFGIGRVTKYAHRIAYELYIGPIQTGFSVLHRCDVRSCVNPSHLFVGTHADNMVDMTRKGRSQRGEKHAMAKLTNDSVREIPAMAASGVTQTAIAKSLGVSRTTICQILGGKVWKHIK